MSKVLDQPYPLPMVSERFIHAFVISAFVYLFLSFLEPFDLNLLQGENKRWIVLGYGLSILMLLLIFYVSFPIAIPGIFSDTKWRVYKEIIWLGVNLCVIGFSLTIYEDLIGTRPMSWKSVYETVAKTTIIGIFPLSGIVLLNQIRLLKKHLGEAQKINTSLNKNENIAMESLSDIITLQSENKSESFHKSTQSILFLAALGNYIEIHTEENGKVEKTILRTTLTKAEVQLSEYSQLYRCHRAFMVNLQNITFIDGNASGYNLHFKNTDKTVPVARRNTSNFKAIIKK